MCISFHHIAITLNYFSFLFYLAFESLRFLIPASERSVYYEKLLECVSLRQSMSCTKTPASVLLWPETKSHLFKWNERFSQEPYSNFHAQCIRVLCARNVIFMTEYYVYVLCLWRFNIWDKKQWKYQLHLIHLMHFRLSSLTPWSPWCVHQAQSVRNI